MKNVRRSVAYLKYAFLNMLAMMTNLNPPLLFMTFSVNEMEWPEVACYLERTPLSQHVNKGDMREKVRSDPLMVEKHIEKRLHSLIKHIINGPLLPLGGKIVDFFVRREFQQRGCVHFHCLFWIENFSELSPGNADRVIEYINRTISTKIPDEETDPELNNLVKRLQIHRHYNNYCKRGRFACCFGFPFPPCEQTHLLGAVDSSSRPGRSSFYQTARGNDDRYVNSFNPVILKHWRGNMDIKVVDGAYGAVLYVSYYMTKSEPQALKDALSK